ncbi:hypothetical protein [Neolewinella agarilytica]|uniref:Cytochrome c domain-containing protein n=1 Tax=Neolewinella agarilytica TaxID=478744 RepID=A0A1H9K2L6_9BACT|nr:hypothetical protein [Neolewinella agarilytica]SEQ93491.1 hypothetical protein SAMN05444359_11963 [Neolewinella agarilytica]
MRFRPDLLRAMIVLFNLALVIFGFTFFYLLFGETLLKSYHNRPVPMEQPGYRSGGSGKTADAEEEIVNGIHVQSGLIYAEGFDIVRGNCTACHSAKLVTQNRATREGWTDMIRWMQARQGLWDLGENEPVILDYLATNYAPEDIGRRATIDVEEIEWYLLELEEE